MIDVTRMNKDIGSRIRKYRKAAHMTQAQLAELLEYSTNHVSAVERGKTPLILEKLAVICDIFGISSDELVFGSHAKGIAGPLLSRVEELDNTHIKYLERIIDVYIESTKHQDKDDTL